MAQAYDAIIATIVVASDATSVTKAMVKSTQWRAGTSGDWLSTNCTLTAGNTYQFRTPLSGMSSSSTAILPNIKTSVTIAWDTSATQISTVGDYFMYYYAYRCFNLTSLSIPDTSSLTSVGTYFMSNYANGCSRLTSLSIPDTSNLTVVGNGFMQSYVSGCSNLTSLSVPDTSGLTTVGNYFMRSYASSCSNLTSLSIPDTSSLTSVGTYFMSYYANGCSRLTSLILPTPGWFTNNNVSWSVPSDRLNYLYGYCAPANQSAWQDLTAETKTLYLNYIRSIDHVLLIPQTANAELPAKATGKQSSSSEILAKITGLTPETNDEIPGFLAGGHGRYVEDFSTTTKKDGATTASWTGDGSAEML